MWTDWVMDQFLELQMLINIVIVINIVKVFGNMGVSCSASGEMF